MPHTCCTDDAVLGGRGADNHRPAGQRRVVAMLDRGEQTIHVQMGDDPEHAARRMPHARLSTKPGTSSRRALPLFHGSGGRGVGSGIAGAPALATVRSPLKECAPAHWIPAFDTARARSGPLRFVPGQDHLMTPDRSDRLRLHPSTSDSAPHRSAHLIREKRRQQVAPSRQSR